MRSNRGTCLAVALAAGLALWGCKSSDEGPPGQGPSNGEETPPEVELPEVRRTQPLMEGWRFNRDDTLSNEDALVAPVDGWDTVTLPHTWNAEDAASLDAGGYERGLGWYRLEFPSPTEGQRHWLEVGAASLVADVWLNGAHLGQHRGGFTQFRFDITDGLSDTGNNVLLIKVDNSAPSAPDDITAIDPLGGDFNVSGGLYRHVALVSTAQGAHIALDDLGGPGVYGSTRAISEGSATVSARAKLSNAAGAGGTFTTRLYLVDREGEEAGGIDLPVQFDANGDAEVAGDIEVASPRLWQGMEDPYLYRLVADLRDGEGNVVDRVVQHFGIREFRIDPEEGFFLNGRQMDLRGVAIHQDFLGKGWAVTDEDFELSFSFVREMGANAVRLGHYPFGRFPLQRLSELGLVLWAESPNGLRTVPEGCTDAQPTADFLDNAALQLRETIRQQYNHAGIALWGIGNETEGGQIFCPPGSPAVDNVTPYLQRLHEVAKEEDPTRLTANAEFSFGGSAVGGGELPFVTVGEADVIGTNRYYWWYAQNIDEFGPLLDRFRTEFPQVPLSVSEYGAGAALTHHTDNPEGGPPEVRSAPEGETSFQPEEYQGYVHEQNVRLFGTRPYLWGTFIWNLFDFGSGHRNEGDVRGVNTKGLVTFDRQTRKDAFFFYKANWTETPVTHLVGKRYTERAYPMADVRVYSNAASVELRVNDAVVGTMNAADCELRTCVFRNVPLGLGANRVVVRGDHGGEAVEDSADWNVASADLNISAGDLYSGLMSSDGQRFGSDHFFTEGVGEYYRSGTPAGGPPEDIVGTADPRLYKYFRRGTFTYELPLADGRYDLTLGFMEPDTGASAGGRVFDVTANGEVLLTGFDVLAEAGAPLTVITRTFTVDVSGGLLTLAFTPTAGDAIVSTLSVRAAAGAP